MTSQELASRAGIAERYAREWLEQQTTAGIIASDWQKQTEAQTPLGRIGQPQDIAPAVVFLASPDAGWITGETLVIAGGVR